MANTTNLDNTQIHQTHQNQQVDTHENHSTDSTAHTDNHAHAEEGNVMIKILSDHLLDHNSYDFYGVFHFDLPIIFYDNGFHFYANKKAMEAEGTFKEIHHEFVKADTGNPPQLNLSITSLVMFQWIAMLLLFFGFWTAAKKYKKNPDKAPSGLQNLIETLALYVRDEIVRPNVTSVSLANRLTPYFISLFFFILTMNLMGLIPGGHSPTGNLAVTAGLAITAYFVINGSSILHQGFGHWIKEFTGGAPWGIWFIMIPIEILSMFTKPFALTVRLFANMTAGHAVILSLVGLIFLLQTLVVVPIVTGFTLFIYSLELLVAFIQAYVFTMLTAVFVGLAQGHGEHSAEHH